MASAGSPPVAPGVEVTGTVDRLDVSRDGSAALVVNYKRSGADFAAASDDVMKRLQLPLYGILAEEAIGAEPAGGLYMGILSPRITGAVRDDVAGAPVGRPGEPGRLGADRRRRRGRGPRRGGPHPAGPARPARPELLLPLVPLRGPVAVSPPTAEQERALRAAAGAPATAIAAGAGAGKTTLLVEAVWRDLEDEGVPLDRILVASYNRAAAAHLVARLQARFADPDDGRGAARPGLDLSAAWVGTFHALAARIVRENPFAAGVDPEFGELDETEAAALMEQALDEAMEGSLTHQGFLDLVTDAPSLAGIRDATRHVHERLRAAGHEAPRVIVPDAPGPTEAQRRELAAAVREASAHRLARPDHHEQLALAAELLLAGEAGPAAPKLSRNCAHAFKPLAERVNAAASALWQALLDGEAREQLRGFAANLEAFGARYAELKRERGALDYEDLLLAARRVLRGGHGYRFARAYVDEFQDANALQAEILDLLAAERTVVVGRRLPGDLRLPPRRRRPLRRARGEPARGDAARQPPQPGAPAARAQRAPRLGPERGADLRPADARRLRTAPARRSPTRRSRSSMWSRRTAPGPRASRRPRPWPTSWPASASAGTRGPTWPCCSGPSPRSSPTGPRSPRAGSRPTSWPGGGSSPTTRWPTRWPCWRSSRTPTTSRPSFACSPRPTRPPPTRTWSSCAAGPGRRPDATGPARAPCCPRRGRWTRRARRWRPPRPCGRCCGPTAWPGWWRRAIAARGYDLAVLGLPDGARRHANLRKLVRMAADFSAVRGPDLRGFLTMLARMAEAGGQDPGRGDRR